MRNRLARWALVRWEGAWPSAATNYATISRWEKLPAAVWWLVFRALTIPEMRRLRAASTAVFSSRYVPTVRDEALGAFERWSRG